MVEKSAFAKFKLLLTLTLVAAIVGCGGGVATSSGGSSDDDDDDDPVSPPTASTYAPLQLNLTTIYDDTTYTNNLKFAETGTTLCQATATSPSVTCTVSVEEGRLYFSKMYISFSWMPKNCTLFTFQPYYYQRSAAGAYTPPGADDPVDCTANPTPLGCFGGVAPQVVKDFPKNGSLIYFPDENNLLQPQSDTLTVDSGYSLHTFSNRLLVNDLDAAKVGTSFAAADLYDWDMNDDGISDPPDLDTYLLNTYVDYSLSCRDHWYDPLTYEINIRIRDVNSSSGNMNHFGTWAEVP